MTIITKLTITASLLTKETKTSGHVHPSLNKSKEGDLNGTVCEINRCQKCKLLYSNYQLFYSNHRHPSKLISEHICKY